VLIIYENEPLEKNVMNEKPRQFSKTFFRASELVTSIVQGMMITTGLVAVYWIAVRKGASLAGTTSMVFVAMITSNIVLTLVNRSFNFSIVKTIQYKNRLIPLIIGITVVLVMLIFSVQILRNFFRFEPLQWRDVITCVVIGSLSVIWFEGYKWIRRIVRSSVNAGTDGSHPATR
jgi:P-type Ca2+ transporter type 2C